MNHTTSRRRLGAGLRVQAPLLLTVVVGCASAGGSPVSASGGDDPAPAPRSSASTAVPFVCAQDSDCVVKDVGNCCGYYPACVHREQAVDPEGVRRQCAEKGQSSICGFAEIRGCRCVSGACQPADGIQ